MITNGPLWSIIETHECNFGTRKLFTHHMSEPQGKVFHVQYQDKASVYNCYMSFAKDGGLFVPSSHQPSLGDLVLLMVRMPERQELFMLSAKVSWISHGRRKGFGVRMSGDEGSKILKVAIENILGSNIRASNPTYTM